MTFWPSSLFAQPGSVDHYHICPSCRGLWRHVEELPHVCALLSEFDCPDCVLPGSPTFNGAPDWLDEVVR